MQSKRDYGDYVDIGFDFMCTWIFEILLRIGIVVIGYPAIFIASVICFPLWVVGKLVKRYEEKHG